MTTNLTGCKIHNIEQISFRMRVGRWNVRPFSSAMGLHGLFVDFALFALAIAMTLVALLLLFLILLLVGIVGFPIGDSTDRRRTRTKNDAFIGQ